MQSREDLILFLPVPAAAAALWGSAPGMSSGGAGEFLPLLAALLFVLNCALFLGSLVVPAVRRVCLRSVPVFLMIPALCLLLRLAG